jgi:hypothetical protein
MREGHDKSRRLIELCLAVGATHYLTGPKARNYLVEEQFLRNNITIEYLDFNHYPEYPQLFGNFIHEVSILDLIFNTGENASKYMKSFRQQLNE